MFNMESQSYIRDGVKLEIDISHRNANINILYQSD